MRKRLIVGNWKLHKTASEAAAFVYRLSALARATDDVEVVLAPPFTALHAAAQAELPAFPFALGAQNLFWEDKGPFTGEVSAPMLKELGCRYVILGHSERRRVFGEQDGGINKKVLAALRHGLRPILCIGETLTEREEGRTDGIVTRQLLAGLEHVPGESLAAVAIAYEPVWAIGTGRAASAEQATAVHRTLRKVMADRWSPRDAEPVRILYGGSVTPENAGQFLAAPDIDGALVGGACLDPQSFATIIEFAQARQGQN
ncbi:MAG: triose-phosphate isomerase [Nitrospirota bacterium]|nr:triose-phosphate isomerase [Nitrospirota bacterium]MDE3034568.1 triose-phosphate isomerase [Nitrospirota bacterium]MDE3225410.1 triose-phosphate isomerase [Nitrospirota bacterium]MDE3244324.1 triose-phosphate isomerase [Nitrospirota bacterium]